jgi:hypothetical protein
MDLGADRGQDPRPGGGGLDAQGHPHGEARDIGLDLAPQGPLGPAADDREASADSAKTVPEGLDTPPPPSPSCRDCPFDSAEACLEAGYTNTLCTGVVSPSQPGQDSTLRMNWVPEAMDEAESESSGGGEVGFVSSAQASPSPSNPDARSLESEAGNASSDDELVEKVVKAIVQTPAIPKTLARAVIPVVREHDGSYDDGYQDALEAVEQGTEDPGERERVAEAKLAEAGREIADLRWCLRWLSGTRSVTVNDESIRRGGSLWQIGDSDVYWGPKTEVIRRALEQQGGE